MKEKNKIMDKVKKIASSFGIFGIIFLSPLICYTIFMFFTEYNIILFFVLSIVMIFVGMTLLVANFENKAYRNNWKSTLCLVLTTNPILFIIYFIFGANPHLVF